LRAPEKLNAMIHLKKNILLLAAGLLLFAACKKQYSCQCTTTVEKPGYYPFSATSIEPVTTKTTKRGAEKLCGHAEKQLTKNHEQYKAGDETLTVSCAVKK
jgi:uncharacterized lipoprotein YajG